ncbi:hypothetical protein RFI_23040 [Reticulomyxa filosa]|uniref:Uncharacterized protein n=1 Tax=Reticulomyxa filosa TaxID=46433 RepID=X6MKD9_RETFI|nr:hypothetical protein RFI_23040 [Reticulomyxa filosa]|eukprot:ETO14329.1 hypothetical protein RFI_23040 [Reticulomyxa filosa]
MCNTKIKKTIRKKEVFVISDTLKTIQMCTLLEKVGLLGKLGNKMTAETKNADLENDPSKHVIGIDHKFMADSVSKNMAVFKVLQTKKYAHDQILYVDNVKPVIEYFNSIALCRTVLVNDEYGIGETTCEKIENMFEKAVATTQMTLEKHTSYSTIPAVTSANSKIVIHLG